METININGIEYVRKEDAEAMNQLEEKVDGIPYCTQESEQKCKE